MNTQELHVIFGTGPMGRAIALELQRRGKTIRMVNRSGKAPFDVNNAEVVAGDAYDVEFTRRVTKGAVTVYQAAQPEYHQWPEKFPALQTAILEGTAVNQAKLAVVENLYMYGKVDGPIHENLPYQSHTRKGKVRAQMAQQLLDAHRAGKVRVVIGRGSNFFGPADSAGAPFIWLPLLAGKAVSGIGNIDLPHTYTFTEDFGKALVMLADCDPAFGQVWHVPNAPTVTTRQLLELAFQIIGQRPRVTAVNGLMMRMAGLFVPAAREMVEMMYEFTNPFVVDHAKFVKMFGDISTPLDVSVRKTIDWFRVHPEFKPH